MHNVIPFPLDRTPGARLADAIQTLTALHKWRRDLGADDRDIFRRDQISTAAIAQSRPGQ